jgi:hypothetical protein
MHEPKSSLRASLAELLDLFSWGIEVFSRRDCLLILTGLRSYESEQRGNELLSGSNGAGSGAKGAAPTPVSR